MGYTKQIITGLSWMASLRAVTKAASFLEMLILARVLIPEQFGAYTVALMVLGLLEVMTETGVAVVLIQTDSLRRYINAAWLISIVRGVIISLFISYN